MNKILTVVGIRPDFIRMSEIIKKFDNNFEHILVHSGQHYNFLLSDIFFKDLNIRKPDYNLEVGGNNKPHYIQTSELAVKLISLLNEKNIKPDTIVFLGDSNSVLVAPFLKKEGYNITHIEAGMRSGDKRMFEEINRIVCDQCSNNLFVYHENYKKKLKKENILSGVEVVGNTIVEVANDIIKQNNIKTNKKLNSHILLDIHRPENFLYINRMKNIIDFANSCIHKYSIPVKMLNFHRTMEKIKEYKIDLKNIEIIDLMSYVEFMKFQYNSLFIISDSGTAQEEPALLDSFVLVPRDYTERPESVINNCSIMLNANSTIEYNGNINFNGDARWLGYGKTSDLIVNCLKNKE